VPGYRRRVARQSAGESVLSRHLRVLDAFDAHRPFLTLSELAEGSGLARSTAHRLLAELEAAGLVERWPDRTYRLGARLYELAARSPGALGLREQARPFLLQVQARVRQHTQLAVLAGTDVLYIERFSAKESAINHTILGGRTPAHASAFGLAMLAHAPQEAVRAVIAAGFHRYTERTIRSAGELRATLRRVRAEGHAVTPGHIHPASAGIAVPVLGPHGAVYAAVGVIVPNDGASPLPHVRLLREAAAAITLAQERAIRGDE